MEKNEDMISEQIYKVLAQSNSLIVIPGATQNLIIHGHSLVGFSFWLRMSPLCVIVNVLHLIV